MGFDGILKRFAVFAVIRLLGINDLHSQLSQIQQVTPRRAGGTAILAAHLHTAKQDSHDSNLLNRTLYSCRK